MRNVLLLYTYFKDPFVLKKGSNIIKEFIIRQDHFFKEIDSLDHLFKEVYNKNSIKNVIYEPSSKNIEPLSIILKNEKINTNIIEIGLSKNYNMKYDSSKNPFNIDPYIYDGYSPMNRLSNMLLLIDIPPQFNQYYFDRIFYRSYN